MSGAHVGVFVGTRADLSPLGPVIAELAATQDVDLTLLTGVAFSSHQLEAALAGEGVTAEIRVVSLAPPLQDLGELSLTAQGAVLASGVKDLLGKHQVDVLLVLGDRWELLYVVPSFFLAKVPVVHLHGGEVTEGALDDRVRHAITKLSDQHCAATRGSVARLEQMGEPPERIHLTGAPGLDRLHRTTAMSDESLSDLLGTAIQRPLALFTYHPSLADPETTGRWAEEALNATLDACATVVATFPGFDTGREAVIEALRRTASTHPRLVLREQLGADYPAVLASCDVVVGNSSSGIIEAAGVGVPSVDIGDRQAGRERSRSVIHSDEGRVAVGDAVRHALSLPRSTEEADPFDPYRDGRASERIRDVVLLATGGERRKEFADLHRRTDA